MAEEQQQDGQKTLVAFVVGLLIGGMLVWAFSEPTSSEPALDNNDETTLEEGSSVRDTENTDRESDTTSSATETTPELQIGNGSVSVLDQTAGMSVTLDRATYPVSEGWIGVREYTNDKLGFILGVVRFSESQGLVPSEIVLQRSTTPGNRYAVVIFTEDGDFDFNLASDVQIDEIFDTFIAQ